MKTQKEIEKDLEQAFISHQSEVTYLGLGGSAKGMLTALSIELSKLWYNLERNRKKVSIFEATGDDLSEICAGRGIDRGTATKASAVLIFNGPVNTVIPKDTEIKSASQISFKTTQQITIGAVNRSLNGQSQEISLADKVTAESQTTGSTGNVAANTITDIQDNDLVAAGVTCTNPIPAEGGADSEADAMYRYRTIHRLSVLNQSTKAFFEAVAWEADENVLRTWVQRGGGIREVVLKLARKSGADFTSDQLNVIEQYVQDKCPVATIAKAENLSFTDVNVSLTATLKTGYTKDQVFTNLADKLAAFLNWKLWDWWTLVVQDDDLLALCNETEGVDNIDTATFSPSADIIIPLNSLPKLASVSLNTPYGDKYAQLEQSYL